MLEVIGNKMQRITDKEEPMSEINACAKMCVEANIDAKPLKGNCTANQ